MEIVQIEPKRGYLSIILRNPSLPEGDQRHAVEICWNGIKASMIWGPKIHKQGSVYVIRNDHQAKEERIELDVWETRKWIANLMLDPESAMTQHLL